MSLLNSILKLLSFNLTRDEMVEFNNKHLLAGFIGTWIVGMGRYWDDPNAKLLQHLGMGSVLYIFLLAGFIWLIVLPYKTERWTYKVVLTFISLTSFPAIFYAIPVEKFFSVSTANTMNVWFLAIVALWRLRLLYYFLRVYTGLSNNSILTVTLLPICLIISSLTVLNLHNAVFGLMGGFSPPTPHDASYFVLMVLTGLSSILVLPLLIAYGVEVYKRRAKR